MVTYGVKLHRSDILRLPEHPDACTEATFANWCNARVEAGERLAVDLFSGAGGLSLGIEQAGWKVAASVDHDVRALETHRHNFPGLALDLDLGSPEDRNRLVDLLQQTTIDLIAGGPPCQPFSRAGRSKIRSLVDAGVREVDDQRRDLWRGFLDVVLRVRPRAALMENVADMALGDDLLVVRTIVEALEEAGYHSQINLVDAWRHGVPQHRKRLILLARQDENLFRWPADQPRVSLREAIEDLPRLEEGIGGRSTSYLQPAAPSDFAALMRKDADSETLWDHMTRPVRDDDRTTFALMDSKTLYGTLPAENRRYRADTFDDKYKRLDWDDLSRSITAHIAKDGYWYIHPQEHRTLTVREAARIQTFPDRYRFAGTRSDAFRQIGNAVPPLLGEAAARALSTVEKSATPPDAPTTPPTWLQTRAQLAQWAAQQRMGDHWSAIPGPQMTPAVAAVVTLLSRTRIAPHASALALARLGDCAKISRRELDRLSTTLGTQRAGVLDRLRPLTGKQRIWKDPDQLETALALNSSESQLFRLLTGDDALLTTQAALRVAARVSGTESDTVNRLSDGKVDLARLVGGGSMAPARMAAVRLLGLTVCRKSQPLCHDCPLLTACHFAAHHRATLF